MTLTGVDDYRDDGDQVTAVTFAIDAANSEDQFDAVVNQSITVTTTDDDTAGFTVAVTGGTTEVGESAGTDSFSVVLNAQPVADVVLTVVVGNPSEVAVSPATLTFTAANWNQAKTVTVSGVDDFVLDGDKTSVITLRIDDAASDNVFDPVADQTLSVKTLDDDLAGFTALPTGGTTSVTEAGTTDTFSVALTVQPLTDVVLAVTSGDLTEATVAPATLTFTPANWNVPQVVTVTGVDDVAVDGPQSTTLRVAVSDAASDDAFDPLADQTLTATTADDDTAGLTVTETGGSTAVSETGSTDTFSVVLDGEAGRAGRDQHQQREHGRSHRQQDGLDLQRGQLERAADSHDQRHRRRGRGRDAHDDDHGGDRRAELGRHVRRPGRADGQRHHGGQRNGRLPPDAAGRQHGRRVRHDGRGDGGADRQAAGERGHHRGQRAMRAKSRPRRPPSCSRRPTGTCRRP